LKTGRVGAGSRQGLEPLALAAMADEQWICGMLMVVGGKDVGRVLEPVTGGFARVLALSCLLFSLLLIFIPNTSFAVTLSCAGAVLLFCKNCFLVSRVLPIFPGFLR